MKIPFINDFLISVKLFVDQGFFNDLIQRVEKTINMNSVDENDCACQSGLEVNGVP